MTLTLDQVRGWLTDVARILKLGIEPQVLNKPASADALAECSWKHSIYLEICLDKLWKGWSREQLQMVLLHELAHYTLASMEPIYVALDDSENILAPALHEAIETACWALARSWFQLVPPL